MPIMSWRRGSPPALVAALALILSACGSSGPPAAKGSHPDTSTHGIIKLTTTPTPGCDPIGGSTCLLPFPDNYLTVPDHSTPTGLRVSIAGAATPANAQGVHIDTTELNRNDGFSPGSALLALVPGLDFACTGIAPVTDIGASLRSGAPIVVIDTITGKRVPYFAELDAQGPVPAHRLLIVRPAVNLTEGHHYVVGLSDMRNSSGALIPAGDVFRAYRDRLRTTDRAVEARRGTIESDIETLTSAGVARSGLYLAWDFTVASTQNLAGRMLGIRNDAFSRLGTSAPTFAVTSVLDHPTAMVARRVEGTFNVPLYLTGTGAPGSRFNYGAANPGPEAVPAWTGKYYPASFICDIPTSSLSATGAVSPGKAAVYGHGLLGSNTEVEAADVQALAQRHNYVFCATKWIGMSNEDVANAVAILKNLSLFPTLADRCQQGILNTLFLGRLMDRANGFAANPAFQSGGKAVFDSHQVYFDGNSQGSIMGGAATAVSGEWTRAVLGVAGMNYSTLLQRSTDFATFAKILDPAYPSESDRLIGLDLIQMLWDRAEADGYAAHMTSHPYPGTPAHTVLMQIAFGDHQVSTVTAEVEARTIGAHVHRPTLAAGRDPDKVSFWGIPTIDHYPYSGSAIDIWDSGSPVPPVVNLAPSSGHDPHGDPRAWPLAQDQVAAFLAPGGSVTNVCGSNPCTDSPAS
ncbi:MAG: hypothetical protein ACRD0I_08110 [Acidimicrobiales bacterium]